MSPDVSERSFEEAIEYGLLQSGLGAYAERATGLSEPAAAPWGDMPSGGYLKRLPDDYDRALCLLPQDVIDFVLATQPKEWTRLKQHHGAAVKEQFLQRLAAEIKQRGALDVLRNGIRDSGCKFQLAYFRPASGLNEADAAALRRPISSPSSASSATARRTRTASISCCSSTASRSSPPN